MKVSEAIGHAIDDADRFVSGVSQESVDGLREALPIAQAMEAVVEAAVVFFDETRRQDTGVPYMQMKSALRQYLALTPKRTP